MNIKRVFFSPSPGPAKFQAAAAKSSGEEKEGKVGEEGEGGEPQVQSRRHRQVSQTTARTIYQAVRHVRDIGTSA